MTQFSVYCYSCHCDVCVGRDVYVGKARHGTDNRHKAHLSAAKRIIAGRYRKNDLRFDHFLAKHGIDFCKVRTLCTYASEDEMNSGEIYFIDQMKTYVEYGGLNFDKGGRGGRRKGVFLHSEESKLKQSLSMIDYYKRNPFSQHMKDHLSTVQRKKHDSNPTLGKELNEKSWSTINKLREDPLYEENFRHMMTEKAIKGGNAFLKKFEDENFKSEFSSKISSSVHEWCINNPEKVKERTRKAIESRTLNGKWIENLRFAASKVSKEDRSERIRKGWETRRKNKLNIKTSIECNLDQDESSTT
jgi:hypothetical protein